MNNFATVIAQWWPAWYGTQQSTISWSPYR